jgi:hypothetical protein
MAKPFADDDAEEQAAASPSPDEPEYTFEGFKIDFSTKVMLTPPAPPMPQGNGAVAQAQSRRR